MEPGDSALKHSVTIEDRGKIVINCVDDVESFNDEKAVVYTSMGTMVIRGSDFKVHSLNVDDGRLVIEGTIDNVEYMDDASDTADSGGFFGKLYR